MFKKEQKEKFSFRKYKDGRTDSKLIGATIFGCWYWTIYRNECCSS